jgi:hypothetical protein
MTKTHRVGTITLGGMLVTFGTLFLLHIFYNGLTIYTIFRLWPVIFIFLGVEVLAANFIQKEERLIYDKAAIALIIILTFFAMGMAFTDLCFDYANAHLTVRW